MTPALLPQTIRTDCVPRGPIRICYAIDNLSRAGTETQLLALLRTLDRSRFEPSLVLLDGRSAESQSLEPRDCPILRLGIRKLFRRKSIAAARELRRFWHAHPPDILQAYFLDSAYFSVPLATLSGIPRIVRVRNNLGYWLTRRHRLFNRLIRPWVNVTLTNSEDGREALLQNDRLAPDEVCIIENGVDLERYSNRTPPFTNPGPVRIGCVANLRPVKNIDGLIRAAKMLPDAEFLVAGDGPQREELDRQRETLGRRFRLLGSVADIPGFLNSVDIAVLPSHSEGMSNALLEYMAAGRAIVATDVGANTRVLGGCGTIIPPHNEPALANAIRELVRNPESARSMAATARVRVEREFSREAMRLRFERFYERLAGSGTQ